MLNFDRSTVKHGTQHIQNNCHFLTALECTKFVRPGLRPGPQWGSLQRSPDPLSALRDPTSKEEGEGRERRKGEKKGGEWNGRDRPPLSQIPGSALITASKTVNGFSSEGPSVFWSYLSIPISFSHLRIKPSLLYRQAGCVGSHCTHNNFLLPYAYYCISFTFLPPLRDRIRIYRLRRFASSSQ